MTIKSVHNERRAAIAQLREQRIAHCRAVDNASVEAYERRFIARHTK